MIWRFGVVCTIVAFVGMSGFGFLHMLVDMDALGDHPCPLMSAAVSWCDTESIHSHINAWRSLVVSFIVSGLSVFVVLFVLRGFQHRFYPRLLHCRTRRYEQSHGARIVDLVTQLFARGILNSRIP